MTDPEEIITDDSDEALMAAAGLQNEEQPEEEQAEDPAEPDVAAEEEPERLLAKDYTQKTQVLAEERRALEAEKAALAQDAEFGRQMREWADNDPQGMVKFIQEKATQTGKLQAEPAFQLPDIDPDEMYGNEPALFDALKKVNQELVATRAELANLKGIATELVGEKERSLHLREAQATFGEGVTQADLDAAVKQTGVSDPVAAYAKLNWGKAVEKGASDSAARAASKPKTPTSDSKGFNPKGMNADEIFEAQMKGLSPIAG